MTTTVPATAPSPAPVTIPTRRRSTPVPDGDNGEERNQASQVRPTATGQHGLAHRVLRRPVHGQGGVGLVLTLTAPPAGTVSVEESARRPYHVDVSHRAEPLPRQIECVGSSSSGATGDSPATLRGADPDTPPVRARAAASRHATGVHRSHPYQGVLGEISFTPSRWSSLQCAPPRPTRTLVTPPSPATAVRSMPCCAATTTGSTPSAGASPGLPGRRRRRPGGDDPDRSRSLGASTVAPRSPPGRTASPPTRPSTSSASATPAALPRAPATTASTAPRRRRRLLNEHRGADDRIAIDAAIDELPEEFRVAGRPP